MQTTPEQGEVAGKVEFSGTLYHGGNFSGEVTSEIPFLDLNYLYRDYFLISRVMQNRHPGLNGFGDHSLTLGPGLYTTTREEAEKYARLRGIRQTPVISCIEVPKARFYDFRKATNPNLNGIVPTELAINWRNYFVKNRHLLENFFSASDNLMKRQLNENLASYPAFLDDFVDRFQTGRAFEPEKYQIRGIMDHSKDYNHLGINRYLKRDLSLRDLLRTTPGDIDWTHSWFGGIWVRFVEDELRCDGVISMESGDAEHFEPAPTIVIYNLGVVKSQRVDVITT